MKRALALCLALTLMTCCAPNSSHAQPASGPFTDVPKADPAFDDVRALQAAGIVIGYFSEGTYGGRREITRYEFATAIAHLWLTLDPQTPAASADAAARRDLADKLQDHPLALAALRRLVNEFQPELKQLGQDVPGIQAYLVALRPDLPPMPVSPPFPDVPKDHWAFASVEALRKAGIVTGLPANHAQGK